MFMKDLKQALSIAKRELRGGLAGFRIFLACLTLGVAAIAGVGSISGAIEDGLKRDARKLLGGDVDLRLTHHEFSADQEAWMEANTLSQSQVAQMRAMAIRLDGEDRRLVELKAVDDAYPLFGELATKSGTTFDHDLKDEQGRWPAAIGPSLLERLSLSIGEGFRIGDVELYVSHLIDNEPDRGTQAFNLGPRVIIARGALDETGLVVPGSLIRYHMRLAIQNPEAVTGFVDQVKAEFPKAGWRIRDLENAAPNIQRFVDRVRMFLTLVGLTALLVGGVGIGNAVSAYLESRTGVIATLKCIGASSRLIFLTYLSQLLALGVIGTLLGAFIGSVTPMVVAPLLDGRLPVNLDIGFYPMPVLLAVLYGLLTVVLFSFLPLARAKMVRAADLFRSKMGALDGKIGWRNSLVVFVLALVLGALAIMTADQPKLAMVFVIGAIGALLVFRVTAWIVMRLAKAMPRSRNMRFRLAMDNLHRPGSPTASVVVSLGLGLTVMASIALIEGNLNNQVGKVLRGEAPGFYFIDIQPYQIDDFRDLMADFPGVSKSEDTPMLRGRLTALKGTPVEDITPPPEAAWILRGDRGLTWSRTPPENGKIVKGNWWPEDYSGDPLVSFDAEAAGHLGLDIGDQLTVNILGREVDVTIGNLREIDWTSMGINFVMVFSPGMLEHAPQSYISTAHIEESQENALERAIVDKFPNVSSIRVKEVLESVAEIVAQLGVAVRVIASIAIAAGVLVLAGAIAAGRQKRIYESVLLKVIGATRKDVMSAYILEYVIMGTITAVIAAGFGALASWAVITGFMEAEWTFLPEALILVLVLSVLTTVMLGGISAWSALGTKASPYLRND
ncbi:ABC transporter permease [Curvivirga sp.]|uniref:ABC transporter permease n=1 Tax=Curvivirga sp. TaxID=2856848 RepID=UPI003B5A7CBA